MNSKAKARFEAVITPDTLKALDTMATQMLIIRKFYNKVANLEKKKTEKGLKALASMLQTTARCLSINKLEFAAAEARDYFVHQLIEKEGAKRLSQEYLGFNGQKLKKAWHLSSNIMKLKGENIEVKPFSVNLTKEGISFLVLPHDASRDNTPGHDSRAWFLCHQDHRLKVQKIIDDLLVKYNPIKNSVCTYGSTFEIVEFKNKFDLGEIVVTPEVKQEIELIKAMFTNYKFMKDKNVPFKRGILFSGNPGTGKTTAVNTLVKAALDAGGTVFILSAQGVSFERVYKFADQFAPAMVVWEDFDVIAGHRLGHGAHVSSELLNVLEGNLGAGGVITVATTNRLDMMDAAATRHGRIDKIYRVDPPTPEMKRRLLELHLQFYQIDLDINSVQAVLKSFLEKEITGAAVNSVLMGAQQRATAFGRGVTLDDLRWSADGGRQGDSKLGFQS